MKLYILLFLCAIVNGQHCSWCRNEGYAGYGSGGIYEKPYKPQPIQYVNNIQPVERSGMTFDNFAGGTAGPNYQYYQVYQDQNGNRYTQNDLPNLNEINK
jgi:hypothetical protein